MIKVFYGSDRARIANEVKAFLREGYEVFEGENIRFEDIVNIFKGSSLFSKKRKILIKDLSAADDGHHDIFGEVKKYVDTEHDIVIWETTLSQKKSCKELLKEKNVVSKKYDLVSKIDMRKVFGIYDTALVDGERAVKMLSEIEDQEDPYMFFGLIVNQAIKKYEWRSGNRERKILKELAKVDMQLKSTVVEPWILIKAFLVRLSSL